MRNQEHDAAFEICVPTKPVVVNGSDDTSARGREEDPCRIRNVFRPPNRLTCTTEDGIEQTGPMRERPARGGSHDQPSFQHQDPRGLPTEGGVSWGTGLPAARSLHVGVEQGVPVAQKSPVTNLEAKQPHRPNQPAYKLFEAALKGRKIPGSVSETIDFSWPLHVKDVSLWDWDIIDTEMKKSPWRDIYMKCRQWTSAPFLEERVLEAGMQHRRIAPAMVAEHDIDLLLTKCRIRETQEHLIRCWVVVFCVMEWAKERRRLITEPWLNDVCVDDSFWDTFLGLPTTEDAIQGVLYEGAVLADYPWFYGQIPLEPAAQYFFGFKAFYRGKMRFFVLCSAPTGGRWMPGIAQAVSRTITASVVDDVEQVCDGAFQGLIDESAYIDNSRFVGVMQCLEPAATLFVAKAKSWGLYLNQVPTEQAVRYVFLGIEFDHVQQTVALSPAQRQKMLDTTVPYGATLRDILRIVGSLVFASKVMDVALAHGYHIFKFLRRRIHAAEIQGEGLDVDSYPWKCVTSAVAAWRDRILFKRLRQVRSATVTTKSNTWTMFTDASLNGWGVTVCYKEVHIAAGYGQFVQDEPICVLEARALLYGISFMVGAVLKETQRSNHCYCFIDNTVLLGALHKTWSKNYHMNAVLQNIQREMSRVAGVTTFTFEYVPSAANLADTLSRIYG
jgi:hypothetical protein